MNTAAAALDEREQAPSGTDPVGHGLQAQGLQAVQLQPHRKRQSAALLREPCFSTQPDGACRPRRTRPCRPADQPSSSCQRQRSSTRLPLLLPLLGLVHLGVQRIAASMCGCRQRLAPGGSRTLATGRPSAGGRKGMARDSSMRLSMRPSKLSGDYTEGLKPAAHAGVMSTTLDDIAAEQALKTHRRGARRG